jgi:hypothetical protein
VSEKGWNERDVGERQETTNSCVRIPNFCTNPEIVGREDLRGGGEIEIENSFGIDRIKGG